MRCTALLALSVVLAGVLAAPRSAVAVEPTEIQVYAAASLRNVLEEMAPAVERATGTRLIFNLGASNDLARQIVAANKADVFFSADEGWMDRVAGAGLIDLASRRSPLSNRLVVVVPQESALAIASAADLAVSAIRRVALANPESVPAGRYAKFWLESQNIWPAISERVIPAQDVRGALAAVEAGVMHVDVAGHQFAVGSMPASSIAPTPPSRGAHGWPSSFRRKKDPGSPMRSPRSGSGRISPHRAPSSPGSRVTARRRTSSAPDS